MSIEELRKKVKESEKTIPDGYITNTGGGNTASVQYMARQIYNEIIYYMYFQYRIPYVYDIPHLYKCDSCEYLEICEDVDIVKTRDNIIKWVRENNNNIVLSKTCSDWIAWTPEFAIDINELCLFTPKLKIPKKIIDCIVKLEKDDTFGYVTKSSRGFETKYMPIKKVDISLEQQYNDSLPHSTIIDFINSDSSGLAILHGIPGCGKTTYLRHLIASNPDKDFYILDSSTFNYISDSVFIDYLIEHKNGIFILEDCESLLASRNSTYNSTLAALLNISDGMLGDGLKLKFICTFNANLASIDKALLRKGRLKIKYEFDKLDKTKAQNLINHLGKDFTVTEPMALCDIYNLEEDNGVKAKRKIGF